jgi:hypothetical protein
MGMSKSPTARQRDTGPNMILLKSEEHCGPLSESRF